MQKPIRRGRLRLLLGGLYFKLRRYLKWAFGGTRFARRQNGG